MKNKLFLFFAFCGMSLSLVQPGWAAAPAPTHSTETPSEKIAIKVARIDRDRILRLAEQALTWKPVTITDYVATNSAGGLHDFFSQTDYHWPDPTKPTGLPYVKRDGETNPDIFMPHRMAVRQLKDAVAAFAAAYALDGDEKYVTKAVEWLKVFFLDEKTKMNTHLQYAQAVLGKSTGESYGVIDALHLAEVAMAVRFLETSPAFPKSVEQGLKKWFTDYTQWIITSPNGIKEMNSANNHSVSCFVQLACFAKFTGDEKVLAMSRQRFKEVLFPKQMTGDGSFPEELRRTKPYGYSIFQADNIATLCALLSTPTEDMWTFTLPDGRTPKQAMEFIFPYLADKNKWLAEGRRKDVMHWDDWPARQPCLLFAYAKFGEEKYLSLWKKLDSDPVDLEVRRNMAVTQPLLWLASPADVPLLKGTEKLFLKKTQGLINP